MKHSEPPFDPQCLVDEYFVRDFTEQEIDALNSALAGDPSLKAQFMQSMNDDLDLYEACRQIQEEPILREKAILFSHRKSARVIRLNRINKIAAALIILLSAGGLVYRMMNPPPVPVLADRPVESMPMETLVNVPATESPSENLAPKTPPVLKQEMRMIARVTDLFLLDGDRITSENEVESRQLRVGDLLAIEDTVFIPDGGRLSMKYLSDATTFSFEENSAFKISELNGAKHLELHDGRMVANVAEQPRGKPFRIITDDAELVVLGTRFELMNRTETILAVHSGEVQMNDLSDDDTVSVSAGFYVKSDKGAFTRPAAFQHLKLNPVYSRTLPGIPKKHKKAGDKYIIVDPVRKLRARVDFKIPRINGRISEATLRLRVVPFETDRRGGGTVRVKRSDHKNAPDMGRHSGEVMAGMDLTFSIDPAQLSSGKNQLLLEMDEGGNDFWFGAENSRYPPELHLTIIKD
jgi:hypothetical protein